MFKKWPSILSPFFIGLTAVAIAQFSNDPVFDPLVIALILGMLFRVFVKSKKELIPSINLVASYFIPIGVIFYGAVNLNFVKILSVDTNYIFLFFIVFVVYVISGYLLSRAFCLNEKTTCLIVAGSTICGASAIVVASKVIDAEPDDISNSLIPVFIAALMGLFIILPFLGKYFGLSQIEYGVFSGTVLQFTGFVKASVAHMPSYIKDLAISVKTVRYLGLLFIIPLFGSLIKGRVFFPWFLWSFLGAGIIFSLLPYLYDRFAPLLNIILTILWSITMAAVGLNADIRKVFTKVGVKAFIVSLLTFLIAVVVFIFGIKFAVGL
ncbi:MAG: putative sulfate exporter family transporter [Candidatus Omnitrophica bacterium]|nr:putative sulfate exporter family transporter [Candidatus Omnitrophota bacterium]